MRTIRGSRARSGWAALAGLAVSLFVACGDEEDTLGSVDPQLVGAWRGTITGTLGVGDVDADLEADGTMSARGTGAYCPMAGEWGVNDGTFRISANDECDGTKLNMWAPASAERLDGSWTARSGNGGSFSLTKL
jgi:hypothetical protein